MRDPLIRQATPEDAGAIWALHHAVFSRPDEAALVDRLAEDGAIVLSLVAELDGQVIGNAVWSRMLAPADTLGLGPVAVAEEWRRQGIAARLIAEGLGRAEREGWRAVFALGDPAYYVRFGFDAGAAERFESVYAGPAVQVKALGGTDLATLEPRADVAAAFAELE